MMKTTVNDQNRQYELQIQFENKIKSVLLGTKHFDCN